MKAGGELFKRRGSGGGVSERVREWGDSCLVRYFDQVFKDFSPTTAIDKESVPERC